MSKDNFLKNSLILTLVNSTTGILKFIFAIILSKKLGSEGMGLYGLIMPIYDLFCCLICGGLIAAISKESSIYFSKKDFKNLNKSVKTCLSFVIIWACIIALLVFINSNYIGKFIIKDSRSIYSIKAICPALVFVGLSSILKGYFYGTEKVKIPAFIDIFEKTIRITVVVIVINLFSLKEITKTVTSVYIALSLGELLSFIFLYVFYKIERNKKYNFYSYSNKLEGRAQLLFNILLVSIPLCINEFLTTTIYATSTLITPRRLVSAGIIHSEALSMIGKFSGMSLSIIFFPFIVINSMSIVLIPDLSKSLYNKDYFSLENRIKEVITISFLIGISTLVVCISIPNVLGNLFFNRNDLSQYIKLASLSAPFSYVCASTYSILNGINKQGILLRNSVLTAIEELILIYILTGIPEINILGYGISLIITSITGVILNLREIKKICYLEFSPINLLIYILVGTLTGYILIVLNNIITSTFVLKSMFLIITGFTMFFTIITLLTKHISNK
ncbi:stage V sporulation protein B [Clostridium acetireducens DSM 10703]|uniref:Multidrug-efflux transporter n=1 Tax=Clostridium acetireducens DSM 10703 TaxID=1121290 RepID=A0A1E8EYI8_9CLOT|nr:stage V sporulation protein B [Clostridium acetireducens]OFI05595.1 stage V sporulation protein B [Clostridium acetireducens DSM 10703]